MSEHTPDRVPRNRLYKFPADVPDRTPEHIHTIYIPYTYHIDPYTTSELWPEFQSDRSSEGMPDATPEDMRSKTPESMQVCQ